MRCREKALRRIEFILFLMLLLRWGGGFFSPSVECGEGSEGGEDDEGGNSGAAKEMSAGISSSSWHACV